MRSARKPKLVYQRLQNFPSFVDARRRRLLWLRRRFVCHPTIDFGTLFCVVVTPRPCGQLDRTRRCSDSYWSDGKWARQVCGKQPAKIPRPHSLDAKDRRHLADTPCSSEAKRGTTIKTIDMAIWREGFSHLQPRPREIATVPNTGEFLPLRCGDRREETSLAAHCCGTYWRIA